MVGRLFGYTEGNRCIFFIAVICALIAGAVHPGGALFLANILFRQFTIYSFSKVNVNDPQIDSVLSEA